MNPLCIYHANCADGFTSAWVVNKALNGEVDFHPAVYQNPPPDVEDRDVLIVDFSYKRPVLLKMAEVAEHIYILDHHKSASEDLKNISHEAAEKYLCPIEVVFDMERSGAGITWDYFFPDAPRPMLLNHIEDRDLWKFALAGTREIQATVFSYAYEFKTWDHLMNASLAELKKEGEAIERKHFKDIRELIQIVTRPMLIGGFKVPIANLPLTLTSDAGHIMSKGVGTDLAPEHPFAGCYWDTPEGRVFSLHSADGGADVSAIAKQYGGGGHAHAAGFRISWNDRAAILAIEDDAG